ncbi:helix-turn-helix transcriptional regulator [Hymenobacter sp. BRD128]|uniref:helix-turn-helix transcriptional regulator n=1 Tax=Hymenobacter sp. BRD128 TaxID=2675878 RepID=UPI001564C6B9|nr:helix-turn-helix transcriptional regulator [Hymenobacter sp. BRD128]QKG56324.1 helix-turn-helix transcriptional regulator [Hymenobacter sp. BRD128]
MPAPESIGQRFTQLIQQLGMSKNAFAQSLDKTATVIQHLVDERNKPGYDLLCKVFETYPNVSKDWLLLGQGPMLVTERAPAEPASPVATPASTPPAADLFAPPQPAIASAAVPPVAAEAPTPTPVAPAPSAAATPVAPPMPVASPAPTAPAPDPAYLTVALQTQYLQHQLALAEQRNQHLLEQQALMQQLVAVLQRNV